MLRRAFEIAPDDAHTVNDFGNVAYAMGRYADAEALFRRAVSLQANFAPAHNNLGNAFAALGKVVDAEVEFRKALALQPQYAEAQSNLALVLREAGRLEEAKEACLRATDLQPNYADAFNNLGNICRDLGQLEEAIHSYERVLTISQDHPNALANLANVLKECGRLQEAVQNYRRALEIKPSFANAHSNLIFCLDMMDSITLEAQQQERKLWYDTHARALLKTIEPHSNDRNASRRLRIGYVSADFRRHSAYNAFGPVIAGHGDGFEIYCYSGVKREDDATARLKRAVRNWSSTIGISDEALARRIRGDRIDILVDLSGHSAGHRLQTFARKPAPVQITAWGHATGTGLATIDYLFADDIVVQKSEHHLFAEGIVELPCVVCYEPPHYLPEVSALPALRSGSVTFGCVNRLEKVTDAVIRLWGRVVNAVPNSRLLIKDRGLSDQQVRLRLLKRLSGIGEIHKDRVVLEGWSPHREHLETFHQIDVALDPFPHGGGISTLEAFWMGVPAVTQLGMTIPSRLTGSLLSRLGMPEWVGRNDEEYIAIAIRAASDLNKLAHLRRGLRVLASASAFGDLKHYTSAVEDAYRRVWGRWCDGQAMSV